MAEGRPSLVVAAVVKDNERTIGRLFKKLDRLRGKFADLAFVVYENNSVDGTKERLGRLQGEIPSFDLVSEDLPLERLAQIATVRHRDGEPCRIEILAYLRERLRKRLLETRGSFDCVLVIDADAVWFSARGLLRAAARIAEGEWDCVCANGMTKRLGYRDAFAFRSAEHPFGPEFLGDYWREKVRPSIQRPLVGAALVPVYSAFGGAALYSMAAYASGEYGAIPGPEFVAAQTRLDATGASAEELGKVQAKPLPNTNYLGPIVCEHVYFHYRMREAGYGRICVDPRWRMLFLD